MLPWWASCSFSRKIHWWAGQEYDQTIGQLITRMELVGRVSEDSAVSNIGIGTWNSLTWTQSPNIRGYRLWWIDLPFYDDTGSSLTWLNEQKRIFLPFYEGQVRMVERVEGRKDFQGHTFPCHFEKIHPQFSIWKECRLKRESREVVQPEVKRVPKLKSLVFS